MARSISSDRYTDAFPSLKGSPASALTSRAFLSAALDDCPVGWAGLIAPDRMSRRTVLREITGLSASGKPSLVMALEKTLTMRAYSCYVVDSGQETSLQNASSLLDYVISCLPLR